MILRSGAEVGPEDLPKEITRQTPRSSGGEPAAAADPYEGMPLHAAREALDRRLIQAALDRHSGNVTRAAADLGLLRTDLHRRIKALGLGGE